MTEKKKATKKNGFGERLSKIRNANRMTQLRLGVAIGIRPKIAAQAIYRYEKLGVEPKIGVVKKLAKCLDCKIEDLI